MYEGRNKGLERCRESGKVFAAVHLETEESGHMDLSNCSGLDGQGGS